MRPRAAEVLNGNNVKSVKTLKSLLAKTFGVKAFTSFRLRPAAAGLLQKRSPTTAGKLSRRRDREP